MKKIAVGESHSYLINILKEARMRDLSRQQANEVLGSTTRTTASSKYCDLSVSRIIPLTVPILYLSQAMLGSSLASFLRSDPKSQLCSKSLT